MGAQDAAKRGDDAEVEGVAISRADDNGRVGQEAANHDLPEDQSILPGSPQPEPEPAPATNFQEVAEGDFAPSLDLLLARNMDSLDEPGVQSALFESTSERPLTPVASCVGLPPVRIVRRTFAGTFADSQFPYNQFSFTKALVAHAQVYCFADSHLLEPLKNLALQRLSQTLRKVDCEVADASATLTTYVYENTRSDTDEPLRKVVSQFGTINYTSLLHGDFEDLISQGGDFTRDVTRKHLRRLCSHRRAAGYDGQAADEALFQLQSQLSEKDDKIKTLEEELQDANAWSRGLGRRKARR